MKEKIYTELCNAYESLTLVLFDMHRYGIEAGIEAHNLLGKLIAMEEELKQANK